MSYALAGLGQGLAAGGASIGDALYNAAYTIRQREKEERDRAEDTRRYEDGLRMEQQKMELDRQMFEADESYRKGTLTSQNRADMMDFASHGIPVSEVPARGGGLVGEALHLAGQARLGEPVGVARQSGVPLEGTAATHDVAEVPGLTYDLGARDPSKAWGVQEHLAKVTGENEAELDFRERLSGMYQGFGAGPTGALRRPPVNTDIADEFEGDMVSLRNAIKTTDELLGGMTRIDPTIGDLPSNLRQNTWEDIAHLVPWESKQQFMDYKRRLLGLGSGPRRGLTGSTEADSLAPSYRMEDLTQDAVAAGVSGAKQTITKDQADFLRERRGMSEEDIQARYIVRG